MRAAGTGRSPPSYGHSPENATPDDPVLSGRWRQSLPSRPDGQLGARGEAELRQGVGDVALDGALADAERAGKGTVGLALRDESRDLALACGEAAEGLLRRSSWRRWPGRRYDDRALSEKRASDGLVGRLGGELVHERTSA